MPKRRRDQLRWRRAAVGAVSDGRITLRDRLAARGQLNRQSRAAPRDRRALAAATRCGLQGDWGGGAGQRAWRFVVLALALALTPAQTAWRPERRRCPGCI